MGKLKKDELRQEKVMFEIAQENKRMSEPLEKARADVERLTKELGNYEKDKEKLKVADSLISSSLITASLLLQPILSYNISSLLFYALLFYPPLVYPPFLYPHLLYLPLL